MEDIIRKKRNVDFTVYENGIIRRIYQQYYGLKFKMCIHTENSAKRLVSF